MFDIGFWELALVGVIALLVFGPERLPRVAREAALWIKKARSVVASVKEEINHELELQDLKQQLMAQKKLTEMKLTEQIDGISRQVKEVAEPSAREKQDEQA